MGYNKMVFVRNDFFDSDIKPSPQSVVYRIGSYGGDSKMMIDLHNLSLIMDEPRMHSQAMTVFREVHASDVAVYVLAGNTCKEVLSPEVKTIKGKKYYLVPVGFEDDAVYAR